MGWRLVTFTPGGCGPEVEEDEGSYAEEDDAEDYVFY